MEKNNGVISIHLPDDLKRQFSALAQFEGLDSSSKGRQLIEEFLNSKKTELALLQGVFESVK